MITLHGFGPNLGMFDPSPYVLKVDVFLRMAEIKYQFNTANNNLSKAPKGKLPFLSDDGQVVADSFFIVEHLTQKYQVSLDHNLSTEQSAIAHLVNQSLNEHFYFCLVYSRWIRDDTWPKIQQAFFGAMPPVVKGLISNMIRKKVRKGMQEQGFARHSHEEIMHLTQLQLQALSDLLGEQTYFMGQSPTTLDASCYGFLAQMILADIDNPYNELAKKHPNLVNYCHRMHNQYY